MVAQAFRIQVKNALEHLHDSAALEVHPLLAELSEPHPDDGRSGADRLRAVLAIGIEGLRPRPELPPNTPAWRCYPALHSRYVQGMAIGDIERALGIAGAISASCAKPSTPSPRYSGSAATAMAHPKPRAAGWIVSHTNRTRLRLRRRGRWSSACRCFRPSWPVRVPATLVVRERLLRQLDAALSHRLTLAAASAGWGKTTLLATCLRRKG